MKWIIPFTFVVALFLGFAHYDTAPESRQLVVEVTSADPDQPVTFKAAYLFTDHESELQVEEVTTPFSATAVSRGFTGIFRSIDDEAGVNVRLLVRDGETDTILVSGEGPVVTMQETGERRTVASYSVPEE